jgi:hypothetical protein
MMQTLVEDVLSNTLFNLITEAMHEDFDVTARLRPGRFVVRPTAPAVPATEPAPPAPFARESFAQLV